MNKENIYGLSALLLAALACSPVIAISWNEFLVLGVLTIVLLGLPLYRLIRRIELFLKRRQRDE